MTRNFPTFWEQPMKMWKGLMDTAAIRRSATTIAVAAALLAGAAGCRNREKGTTTAAADQLPTDERTLNSLMGRAAEDDNERNAILAERTIYSHAFQPATAELNELGMRQVRILANAYPQ